MEIAILLLAVMVVLQQYLNDKESKKLQAQIKAVNLVNSELITTTEELLKIDNLIVNEMIRPLAKEVQTLEARVEELCPPGDSKINLL